MYTKFFLGHSLRRGNARRADKRGKRRLIFEATFSAGVFIFYLTILWQKRESARADGGRETFPAKQFCKQKSLENITFSRLFAVSAFITTA